MRTSKRSQLIQAALEIIDKKSLDALTYDSLAKASGMSKSGLLYHFPSRTALLLALNEHLASSWRASLLEAAGAPPEELSARERLRAVVEVLSQSATRADLLLALDTHTREEGAEVWDEILGPGCFLAKKFWPIQISTCCTSLPTACGCTTTSIPTI